MTWTALPNGQSVAVTPGNLYAIVARVKSSHNQTDLSALVQAHWGLNVLTYGEQGQAQWPNLPTDPDSGHKNVFAVVSATKAASVPWSVPWPLSYADDSSLTSAWSSSDTSDQNVAPTPIAQQAAAQPTTPGETTPGAVNTLTWAPVNVPSMPVAGYIAAGAALGVGVHLLWPKMMRVLMPKGPIEA